MLKNNGQVRISGDFEQTVNHVLQTEKYPIPNIGHLYFKVSGGHCFKRLDLSGECLQIPLAKESQELTSINTHDDLFSGKPDCVLELLFSKGLFNAF